MDETVCPPVSVTLPIFSLPCKTDKDCDVIGQVCCNVDGKMRCRKGVPRPTPKPTHTRKNVHSTLRRISLKTQTTICNKLVEYT